MPVQCRLLKTLIIDGLPFGIVLGQHAPLRAGDNNIEHRVDNLTHVNAPGATTRLRGWDQRHDTLPLAVGQISWVQLVLHTPRVPRLPTRPSPPY